MRPLLTPVPADGIAASLKDVLEHLALAAGEEIMAVMREGVSIQVKPDLSPVTEADQRAEAVILAGLAKAFPGIPVVAEEEAADGRVPECGSLFFIVDPLDGTKEFVAGNHDFTVNIALIENAVPVAGIVYAPIYALAWIGCEGKAEKLTIQEGRIVQRTALACHQPGSQMRVVASRSHRSPQTEAFLSALPDTCTTLAVGSSIKFCFLADGSADLYPRFSRTMEWDTAAGDAVLRCAGGRTLVADGQPLAYGKRNQVNDCDFANPWFIAEACGCQDAWKWPSGPE